MRWVRCAVDRGLNLRQLLRVDGSRLHPGTDKRSGAGSAVQRENFLPVGDEETSRTVVICEVKFHRCFCPYELNNRFGKIHDRRYGKDSRTDTLVLSGVLNRTDNYIRKRLVALRSVLSQRSSKCPPRLA